MKLSNILVTLIYFSAIIGYYFFSKHDFIINFLWIFHYSRRIFESLFIHEYSRGGLSSGTKEFQLGEFLGGFLYYGGAGVLNGWSTFHGPLRMNFVILFFCGEIGNFYHHYLISKGQFEKGLFYLLHKPHYTFELLTWFSWALLMNNYSAWGFFLVSFLAMTNIAKSAYRKRAPYFMFPYIW